MAESHCHENKKEKKWYQNNLFLITVAVFAPAALSYVVPVLESYRLALWMYFGTVWWAILLGLFIGGVIDHYVPKEYISHILSARKKRTILSSVILGFFMSTCSHGILAISIQLYKKGASVPAVVAFLLASPWANFTFTVMLVGFFGLSKALFIVGVSLIIALTTGWAYQMLDHYKLIEHNPNTLSSEEGFSVFADMKKRMSFYRLTWNQFQHDVQGIWKGALSLSNMVLWWLMIGIGLSAAIAAYVPQHLFHQYLGPSIAGLLVTLVIATVIEVCSEGTAPLAYEIFRQTGALGNSFVFLMAGVATDYTEIGLLWANIGRKTAFWLPVITVPQIIFWGILANIIF